LGSISRNSRRARPFGDFAHQRMQLGFGRFARVGVAADPARSLAQRRAAPQTGGERLRRRGAAGGIGEGEAVRRPGEAIARPQVDVETKDGLAALGAQADEHVGRSVEAVGQQEQHRGRPRRGRRDQSKPQSGT
jgi:hypothetical protein